ncbi:penicillin amidase [Aliiruegeria haliotis]|uniref:Penicillin amidase n=1 Tax=Aliiruegeria haliotis TaxID=1280846 RepID=A0A2T0S0H6_9RHOB|nr:linear amide C-N hydrolase [Aliiruegeria haliotis]PRY26937.1 penicillin amidase [Aliiruegeria haliotis]
MIPSTSKPRSLASMAVTAVLATALSTTAMTATACSFFNFSANDNHFAGRTNELPIETDEQLVVVPQGHDFHGVEIEHGFVGLKHGDDPFVSSGLNEHGVNIEGLALGTSVYAEKGKGDLSVLQLPAMVLGNASSTDEAVELLKTVAIETDNMSQFGDIPIGFHFVITDAERSVVVEYTNGKGTPDVYENTLGVMTNDPAYPTQMSFAKSLIDGTSYEDAKAVFPEERFAGFDKSPEGRFLNLVAINMTRDTDVVNTDMDGVNMAWSTVNAMEIPRGSVYWRFLSDEPQMDAYSVVIDFGNKDYYLRTYDNLDIRKVDIDAIDFATVEYSAQDIYGVTPSYSEVPVN